MSSGVFEESVEVSGDISLEAADDVATATSFACFPVCVGAGAVVVSESGEHDVVQCPVELTVAVAVDAVSVDDLAAGGWNRCDAAEHREGCSECTRPGCDQAQRITAALMGPMPFWSSRSGRMDRTMRRISFSCPAASAVRSRTRRASVRSTVTVVVVSRSHDACSRIFAAVRSMAGSFIPRNFARTGSGAAMTRLNTCRCASVDDVTAERRAAKSTDSACRSPAARGVPNWARERASRAARIASSGSDFAPLRR